MPKEFTTYHPRLTAAMARWERDFQTFQHSTGDWQLTPEEYELQRDAAGLKNREQWIQEMKQALRREFLIPENAIAQLEKPYGLVFASGKLHVQRVHVSEELSMSELVLRKTARLGTEITHIFVRKENKQHLHAFLQKYQLHDKVTVMDLDTLESASRVSQMTQIASYLTDFMSFHNKFRKLKATS